MNVRERLAGTGLIPVLAVTAVVAVLALMDLKTPRGAGFNGLIASAPAVLNGLKISGNDFIVTDASRKDTVKFWVVKKDGPDATVIGVRRKQVDTGTFIVSKRRDVKGGGGPASAFDVNPWTRRGDPALWSVDPRPNGTAEVSVRAIDGRPPEELASNIVDLPPVLGGGERTWFAAHWSGPKSDLFAVDRKDAPRWTIRIFSGESGFRKMIGQYRTPIVQSGKLRGPQWTVDVGPVKGTTPDFLMFTHGRPAGSFQTEVHALTGRSHFGHFIIRIPTSLSQRQSPQDHFVYTPLSDGGDMLYVNTAKHPPEIRTTPISR